MVDGRDHWWRDAVDRARSEHGTHCPAEPFDSEHLLYLLYTSGTTAKPKGIMHTTAGYLTQVAWTHRNVFDLRPESDVYWCAADVGWVTGHSYIVYGPLVQRGHLGALRRNSRHPPRGEPQRVSSRSGTRTDCGTSSSATG